MSELQLVFLGTGSGRPTPRRNVAGLFVRFGPGALLFDCGEGAQMQLQKASARTSRLDAVFITHFHGDHVNGLPGLLGTIGLNGHERRVTIVGPRGTPKYLRTLHELFICRPGYPVDVVENAPGVVYRGEDFAVSAVKLNHRVPTHGFLFVEDDRPGRFDVARARALGVPAGPLFGVLQRGGDVTLDDGTVVHSSDVLGPARAGRSFAYISDTRPTQRVREAVAGVDVLIHEATYLHVLADQARQRGHSTVREAAEVARDAQVGRLILTHISPKHGSTREILAEARAVFPETVLAEDLAEFEIPIHEG